MGSEKLSRLVAYFGCDVTGGMTPVAGVAIAWRSSYLAALAMTSVMKKSRFPIGRSFCEEVKNLKYYFTGDKVTKTYA